MSDRKSGRYHRIQVQLGELLGSGENMLSRMATINALLYHKMDGFFWVGFYLLENGRLTVGPYQGPLACIELPVNKGVCWTAINKGESVIVPDVHKFPGHIACDSRARSEIVIPVKDKTGLIKAVLDVDSNNSDHFDMTDKEHLEKIASRLV